MKTQIDSSVGLDETSESRKKYDGMVVLIGACFLLTILVEVWAETANWMHLTILACVIYALAAFLPHRLKQSVRPQAQFGLFLAAVLSLTDLTFTFGNRLQCLFMACLFSALLTVAVNWRNAFHTVATAMPTKEKQASKG